MDIDAYMDDVGIFSNATFEDHMQLVGKVLKCLEDNSMKVNPLKCEWGVHETDFLGHWVTPEGAKPWKKKVEAVLRIAPPSNMTELYSFIGAVTYYKTTWPQCSHILAPLTELTSKGKIVWEQKYQQFFEQMKSTM
eukprot:3238630-Ditylum_brightwellii.AAC.1